MIIKNLNHNMHETSWLSTFIWRRLHPTKQVHVGAKPSDCTLIAASSLSHLGDSEIVTYYHTMDKLQG